MTNCSTLCGDDCKCEHPVDDHVTDPELVGRLWGLYYSIYYLPATEAKSLIESLPQPVLRAFGAVQAGLND